MLRTRVVAGVAATALVGTMGFAAAAPAMAKGKSTTVTFTKASAKGLTITAVKPGKGKGVKFTFPAKVKGSVVSHKGGLILANKSTGQQLKIINITVDLKAGTATVDAPDLNLDDFAAFDVAKVKTKKGKTTTNLKVAMGVSSALNGILGTNFKDGQTIAKTSTK
jgi:hypothetical protein